MVAKTSECRTDSRGDEDGDADWKAAIYSVASTSSFADGFPAPSNSNFDSATKRLLSPTNGDDDYGNNHKPPKRKHYQIKAQKLLDDIIEKNLVVVNDSLHVPDDDSMTREGGVRLFKHAPPGSCLIILMMIEEIQGPKERPRLLPRKDIVEKSKKFRRQLKSVVVNGNDIIVAARDACQKALARLEAKDAATKAAAKREEERVAGLKRIRGERWLPSISTEMQLKCLHSSFKNEYLFRRNVFPVTLQIDPSVSIYVIVWCDQNVNCYRPTNLGRAMIL